MTISSAGGLASNGGSGVTTLSVTATAANDVWMVYVRVGSGITVTALSGGNASGWSNLTGNWMDGNGANESIWMGQMTGAGASTITATFSGSVAGVTVWIDAQPFHSSLGSAVAWGLDVYGFGFNSTGNPLPFPMLTPHGPSPELYWGHARVPGSAHGPSAGFSFNNDGNGDPVIYGVVASATAPTMVPSPSGTYQTLAVLVTEVAFIQAKTSQQQTGNAAGVTFSATPALGDLMVVWLGMDTPMGVTVPHIYADGVADSWTPLYTEQGNGDARFHGFYKTANATDVATGSFPFAFRTMQDLSQPGVPQYFTSSFCGVFATFSSTVGLVSSSPQGYQANYPTAYPLPNVKFLGSNQVLSAVFSLVEDDGSTFPTFTHSDPSVSVVQAATYTSGASRSLALTVYLSSFASPAYAQSIHSSVRGADVCTSSATLATATSLWLYNSPFVREGIPQDHPLQKRISYHEQYTVLNNSGQFMAGRYFTIDQLLAATQTFAGTSQVTQATRVNLLTAGVGGDFSPIS